MSYSVSLSGKAEKQFKKFDNHIKEKIKPKLLALKNDPLHGFSLSGKHAGLRYVKITHRKVEYRAVYNISEQKKEVLIIFLGTRENFYKELRQYLG